MQPKSFAKREIQGSCSLRIAIDWTKRGRDVAVWVAISAFLAFINPYGATVGMSALLAFGYWFSLILVGTVGGEATEALVERVWPSAPQWVALLLIALASALAVSTCLITYYNLSQAGSVPFSFYPRIFGLVFIISLAITGIHQLRSNLDEAVEAAEAVEADPAAAFLERLPIKYRGAALYAVSSEDHYLRIHTDRGEELILMRLADAMRELSGAEGLQTHRSWWVAVDGVQESERDNGKLALILKSGAKAPVSRTFAGAVKAKGLG